MLYGTNRRKFFSSPTHRYGQFTASALQRSASSPLTSKKEIGRLQLIDEIVAIKRGAAVTVDGHIADMQPTVM